MSKLKEILREKLYDDTITVRNNSDTFSALDALEAIDDDDDSLILDAAITDKICQALTLDEPIDDGVSSYDPPYKLEEDTADYSVGNNNFLEANNQDFNEIASNYEVNDDTDEQIKAIIEAMKMYW